MVDVLFNYLMERGFGFFLFTFFFFVGIYFVWSIGGKVLSASLFGGDAGIVLRTRKQCRAIAIAVVLLVALLTVSIAMSFPIMRPGIDERVISRNNNYLMEIDRSIFGVYPPLWFQQSNNARRPVIDMFIPSLIMVYNALAFLLNITLFLLFFFRTRLCLQLICAFFLCAIISMPFWYFFPSLSPLVAYWQPILFQEIPATVETALRTYAPLPQLAQAMQESVDFRSSVRATALVVTTIPSMHIAWGFLVAYYLVAFSRLLTVFAVPYVLLNSVSTVVTMQHYAVDTLGGVLVAVIAIVLAGILSESALGAFDPMVLLVQEDVRSVRKWVWESIRRFSTAVRRLSTRAG